MMICQTWCRSDNAVQSTPLMKHVNTWIPCNHLLTNISLLPPSRTRRCPGQWRSSNCQEYMIEHKLWTLNQYIDTECRTCSVHHRDDRGRMRPYRTGPWKAVVPRLPSVSLSSFQHKMGCRQVIQIHALNHLNVVVDRPLIPFDWSRVQQGRVWSWWDAVFETLSSKTRMHNSSYRSFSNSVVSTSSSLVHAISLASSRLKLKSH